MNTQERSLSRSLRACGLLLTAAAAGVTAFGAAPTGQWDFESGNLNATVGAPLTYIDGVGGATEAGTQFGTTTALGIPDVGGVAAKVMKFPANGPGMGLNLPNPANANGGPSATLVNQYTLIVDLLFGPASMNVWRTIIDTDGGAINADAEFFINPSNGIGVNGRYDGAIKTNTWHRIGMVVDQGEGRPNTITKYIDGVRVGVQPTDSIDGRWALLPGGNAGLFADNDGDTAVGYVNSVQLRDVALTRGQMGALGAPVAAGIPQVIPPVPSYLEAWIPRAAYAPRTTDVGVVVNLGDATVADASIVLKLDGTALTTPSIVRADGLMTIKKAAQGPFAPGTVHTIIVSYTDSINGARSYTNSYTSALLFEDFEGLALGPSVEEDVPANGVWTKTAPDGWVPDDTGVPGIGDPTTDGKTEWAGFSFANKDWWALTAGDQDRSKFVSATGTVMIADPDEWDDAGHDHGLYNTFITTPDINLDGIPANTAFVRFFSSWRPECCDDAADLDNSQTATITVTYDDGAAIEVFKYDSTPGSPTYHPDDVNQTVVVKLNNPAGAHKMKLTFALTLAENDWWWAVDDVLVQAGAEPPLITAQPQTQYASEGASIQLTVAASGTAPLSYRWQKGGVDVAGATGTTLSFTRISAANLGDYTAIVQNPGGSLTSLVAHIEVIPAAPITQDLVEHLAFENDLLDTSGKHNDGTAVGAPTFSTGKIGANAMHIGSTDDYVSLGAPADLTFGVDTDFTVSFWTQVTAWNSDPSFIGNKDWNSGSNIGWVIATDGDGRIQWNWAGTTTGGRGDRKDYDGPGGTINDHAWHHVVVSVDRSAFAVTYVDGVQRNASKISTPGNNLNTPDTFSTNIGQDGTGNYGPRFSDADFDDIGIWRRVLSLQEVQNIFAKGNTGQDLTKASFVAPLDKAVSDNLVVYLPFENSLGDSSGHGNNGAAVGDISFAAGKVGANAMHIGATAGYVTLGTPADLNFGVDTDFTIAFWAQANAWGSDPSFIANKDWDSGSNIGYVLATDGDGHFQWNWAGTPTGGRGDRKDYDGPAGLFSDHAWHHIVVSVQRTGNANTYVDGALKDTRPISTPPNKLDTLAGLRTNIGQDGAGDYGSKFTDLNMDDVAIWRRTVSTGDIAAIYAAGQQGKSLETLIDVPRITSATLSGGNLVITVAGAKTGAKLQKRANFIPATAWEDVGPITTGASIPAGTGAAFYRVVNP